MTADKPRLMSRLTTALALTALAWIALISGALAGRAILETLGNG